MTVAHDYNALRLPEVIAEELELIRRFGTSSRGGAGTVDKPMTRTIEKTRIDRWNQGAMPPAKSKLGKLFRQWMNRKPPASVYRVADDDDYAESVHRLRLGLGLEAREEEEMKNKKGLTREDLLKVLRDKKELSTVEVAIALKVSADDVRSMLEGMAKSGLITRRVGKTDRGGRPPIIYGYDYGPKKKQPKLPHPTLGLTVRNLAKALEDEHAHTHTEFSRTDDPLDQLFADIRQRVEAYIEQVIDARAKVEVEKKMAAVRAALLT